MPRFSPQTTLDAHRALGRTCVTWTPDAPPSSAKAYVERRGIAHLLLVKEHEAARTRMADIPFMAAFAEAWDTVVQPLAAWRTVGLESVEAALLVNAGDRSRTDWYDTAAMTTVADFLEGAGCLGAAHTLAVQVERATPIDEPEALVRAMLRVAALEEQSGLPGGRESLTRALAFADDVLGADHPATGLAVTYAAQAALRDEDLDAAESLILRDLAATTSAYGADDLQTATVRSHLAALYRRQGRMDEALVLADAVLEAREQALGAEHPSTLVAVNNLALLYRGEDERERALALYERALEAQRRVLGPAHPSTLSVTNNLCVLLRDMDRAEEAAARCAEALAVAKTRAGHDHTLTLTLQTNGAMALSDLERYDEALVWLEDAVQRRTAQLGSDHPDTLISRYKLGSVYARQGNTEAAEAHLRAVFEGRTARLGAAHPHTRLALGSLIELLEEDGRLADSEPLRRAEIDLDVAAGDTGSAEALYRTYVYGQCLLALERPKEALVYLRQTLEGETALHGADDPSLASTHAALADCLGTLGQHAKAVRHRQKCLAMERAEAEGVSADVLTTAIALVTDLRNAGKHAAAEALRVEVLEEAREALAARSEEGADDEGEDEDALVEGVAELEGM